MKKLQFLFSFLVVGTIMLHPVTVKADPPPNGVYTFIDPATGERMIWNPTTNMYEKRTIFHFPQPVVQ